MTLIYYTMMALATKEVPEIIAIIRCEKSEIANVARAYRIGFRSRRERSE